MFTGIVQGVAIIKSLEDREELRSMTVELPDDLATGIEIGASVSMDGVCLTVTAIRAHALIDCDVVLQSLRTTTLRDLVAGDTVNVERAAKGDAEIGGHPLSGHVDFTGAVLEVAVSEHNKMVRIGIPEEFRRYIFSKGYIAINRASLTVSEISREEGWFEVWLIPETRRATTLNAKVVNDKVNVEIDRGTQILVDTVRDSVKEALGQYTEVIAKVLAEKGIDLEGLFAQNLIKLSYHRKRPPH